MNFPIVATALSKSYGKHVALNRVNFRVPAGTVYGLIGPNGAGKTSALSILAGLVLPTSGQASVLGLEVKPNHHELVSRIGFASPQLTFLEYLKGAELLLTCGIMHGLSTGEAKQRMLDLMDMFDLKQAAGKYISQYSHGMLQKLRLAVALIHAPEILLLDEPFIGLDPMSVYQVSHTLKQLCASGRTIVLTSHDLSLVERLCHKVGILHEGMLKREIELHRKDGNRPQSGLEAALWEVMGTPTFKDLAWI